MKFNFDEQIERRGTNSVKWDCCEIFFGSNDLIPMWVADMDFKSPPSVIEALERKVSHGIFGYGIEPSSMYKAVMSWLLKRHGWKTEDSWYQSTPGIVPAVSFAVLAFTHPGEKVIVQPPVYYPFFGAISNNGRHLEFNNLILENGRYSMDYKGLEKMIDNRTRMLVLCSPHNPVGRVWEKEELERLGEICLKNKIFVISDEIHSDLVYKGSKHIPFASLGEQFAKNSMTCVAPSKTFNLAGLSSSLVIIPDDDRRKQFGLILENLGLMSNNVFGVTALEAAFKEGEEWLEELLVYIRGNYDYMKDFLSERIPVLKVIEAEGTYLGWIDCSDLGLNPIELNEFFLKEAKIALDDGPIFGKGGEGFQRINLACCRNTLEKAMDQLEKAVVRRFGGK